MCGRTSDVVLKAAALPEGSVLPASVSALPHHPTASVLPRSPTKYIGLGSDSLFVAQRQLCLEVDTSVLPLPQSTWLGSAVSACAHSVRYDTVRKEMQSDVLTGVSIL